ncbi:hypothetical protein BOX15_Mlig012765g1 [Macrostomum lignano]|uniref:Uncharacterized protein n=1 Tax=Macrostomum lignano TaxID=282301 RepID=A0A267E9L7_9PLAT|nr:hypothetical protein BOX15_Mlig012765g1 [Macrostomum lignano]
MALRSICLSGFICLVLLSASVSAVSPSADPTADACNPTDRPCENGGTCLSLADGRRICQCPNGWIGANCSVDLNECESSPCRNGGICTNQLNRKFRCDCADGFVGVQCEFADPCLSRKCAEGATCSVRYPNWTERICTCPPGYTGDDCSEDVDECSVATTEVCLNGGTCQNLPGSYSCLCPRHYKGFDCSELHDNSCDLNPCRNGGTCLHSMSSKTPYSCICPTGYSGDECQLEPPKQPDCRSEPCLNGGRCVEETGGGEVSGNFSCRCPQGFSGSRCEISEPKASSTDPCHPNPCSNGGTCVSAADTYSCQCKPGFQGRHCGERQPQLPVQPPADADDGNAAADPWADCPAHLKHRCRVVFADGHCDPECASSGACLRDGLDCAADLGDCPAAVSAHCVRVFGDGRCDQLCNTSACLLDGGDCLASGTRTRARLDLLVAATRDRLLAELPSLLSQLSRSLRLILQLDGEPEVAGGNSLRVQLRVLGCLGSVGAECSMTTATGKEAGRLLAELLHQRRLRSPLPLVVLTDQPNPLKPTPQPPDEGGSQLVALLIAICSLFSFALLAGVLYMAARRKRVATSGTWYPPGFRPAAKSSNHAAASSSTAAAGQDSSSMSLSLSSSSSPLETMVQCGDRGGGVSCRLLGPPTFKRTKYEDTSFLPTSLLEPLNAMHSTTDMSTAATPAASASSMELHRVIAPQGATETPLHLAARYCRADATRHLLESGADPNAPDQFGRTPLHLAIASGAHGAALLLMSVAGADLNARSDDGATPLIVAAKYCELEIASSLLACPQVDPGAADNAGKTALHWAASVNAADLVALLLCRGANRDPPDAQERTPLFLAAYEGAAGAAARLLEAGANRDACDSCGRSPTQAAEARLHLDIARMLRCPPPLQQQPPQLPPPPPPPPPLQQQQPPPPPPRQSSRAAVPQCDYNLAQQHYPPHQYPTPPSHTGLEDSPPQMQQQLPKQPPPLPPHQTALTGYYQGGPVKQQQQPQVGFLTPSPDSGQDSPGQWSGNSFAPAQSHLAQQQQQQQQQQLQQQQLQQQQICYEENSFFYSSMKREVL